jgi:uncharacterized membrane protein YqhA
MYASDWMLAPVYFGLSLALIGLTIKYFLAILHVLPKAIKILISADIPMKQRLNLIIRFTRLGSLRV